eukprot:TRINITY_DN2959_c0_g1_i1.p1 TRINITY_DN2959_c0_g1~~TRINITY_DN2959_c0_g1_i1.p1  ORF type:complete len:168 (+),score=25.89 TRINITY_DN2959_c0_g1_i1:110-613(+)
MNKAQIMKDMILRVPKLKPKALHPKARLKYMRMTQAPEPLTYKLKDIEQGTPFTETPLGGTESLPFHISRTHMNNLPVYREYRSARHTKRTVIRHISGDVEAFAKELTKVVSNAEVNVKVGRVEVKGLHKESVQLWLSKLGFQRRLQIYNGRFLACSWSLATFSYDF